MTVKESGPRENHKLNQALERYYNAKFLLDQHQSSCETCASGKFCIHASLIQGQISHQERILRNLGVGV